MRSVLQLAGGRQEPDHITGLTSGGITGVVARLERAGYLRREPDADDRRKQILNPVPEKVREINDVFGPIRADVAGLLEGFDRHQLTAIAKFLSHVTDLAYRHVSLLRAQMLYAASRSGATAQASAVDKASGESGTNGKHRRKYPKNRK